MNKKIFWVVTLAIGMLFLAGCEKAEELVVTNDEVVVDASDILVADTLLAQLPAETLSELEKSSLLQMRQEEMLARDVYLALYTERGQNIFKNISESEQTHMDTIKHLLDKYEIADPINPNHAGTYADETIQWLYNQLVAQGQKSLVDALQVGATVEDLDIKDLEDFLTEIDNEDIILAYQNLAKGSRNHLRSFIRVLERKGGSYQAQFISEQAFQDIIGGSQENYIINGQGELF